MKMIEEVRTITSDGRLVVPWVIQRALGLEHGGAVRFRVEDGVVTLMGLERRRSAAEPGATNAAPRRTDIRSELAEELKTLLSVAERERARSPAIQAAVREEEYD